MDIASEKQGSDIVMLDIRQLAPYADYFVILSAETARQLQALEEDMVLGLKRAGVPLHHREGNADSGWVLLDFGDVIVHLFRTDEREFYQLDQLWARAPQVVRVL